MSNTPSQPNQNSEPSNLQQPVNPAPVLSAEEALKIAQHAVTVITGYSENAKNLLNAAQVTAEGIKNAQNQIIEAVAVAKATLAEIAANATQAVAARTKISDEQAIIATKSEHIQKAQEHADTVRASLDRTLTSATQQVTAAEAEQAKAEAAAENTAKLLQSVQTTKAAIDAEATTIAAARKTSVESATLTKGLADKSAIIETRVAEYEKKLASFEKQFTDHMSTIETLLRGATSAGLAHAFDERRQTFLKPHKNWQIVFVLSLVAIVVLTVTGLVQVYHFTTAPTYDELVRLWLLRLPIAGALVWLALHSSRESALAKRLEEDYGYKSAIATCFEGFRKQMSDISKDIAATSPLAKLCTDTLNTISSPPGRIYDKHKLTVSPSGEITEAAKNVMAAASAAKA